MQQAYAPNPSVDEAEIRVCIGTEPRMLVPCRVLQYSIIRNTRADVAVDFHELEGGDWPATGPLLEHTGFSWLRWTIPERFRFSGKAIYLDAGQLVLGDIAELWAADRNTVHADVCLWCTQTRVQRQLPWLPIVKWRTPQFQTSVMLIDCEKARGRLMTYADIAAQAHAHPDHDALKRYVHRHVQRCARRIDSSWNVMDGGGRTSHLLTETHTRIAHYTEVHTQPWYFPEHPARGLWERYLIEALEVGLVDKSDIRHACGRYSISNGRPDGMHPYWLRYA